MSMFSINMQSKTIMKKQYIIQRKYWTIFTLRKNKKNLQKKNTLENVQEQIAKIRSMFGILAAQAAMLCTLRAW